MNCLTLAWTPHAPELRGWAQPERSQVARAARTGAH